MAPNADPALKSMATLDVLTPGAKCTTDTALGIAVSCAEVAVKMTVALMEATRPPPSVAVTVTVVELMKRVAGTAYINCPVAGLMDNLKSATWAPSEKVTPFHGALMFGSVQ